MRPLSLQKEVGVPRFGSGAHLMFLSTSGKSAQIAVTHGPTEYAPSVPLENPPSVSG
jgi:hypothetical protein